MTTTHVAAAAPESRPSAAKRPSKKALPVPSAPASEPELKDLPLSLIKVQKDFNARTDFDKKALEDLAQSIKSSTLRVPLEVEPHGDHFILRDGHRRYAAMKSLGLRGTVKCIVRTYSSNGEACMGNLTALVREDAPLPDLAKRLAELVAGTYPGAERDSEEVRAKWTRERLAVESGLGYKHVNNLIRTWANLCEECRVAWREKEIPFAEVRSWAAEKDHDAQRGLLESWLDDQKKEKKRAAEAKAAAAAGDGEGEGGSTDENGDPKEDRPPRRTEIKAKIHRFAEAVETLKGREREIALAKAEALRWAFGDIRELPISSVKSTVESIRKFAAPPKKKASASAGDEE